MAGGSDFADFRRGLGFLHLLGGCARVNQLLRHAVFHQLYVLARHTFAIEASARLQRMRDIIPDGDVVAEYLLAYAVVEKRALVQNGHAAKVIEHETEQVENGGRLEHHGKSPRRQFLWRRRIAGFLGGDSGEAAGIELAHVGRVGLLPS